MALLSPPVALKSFGTLASLACLLNSKPWASARCMSDSAASKAPRKGKADSAGTQDQLVDKLKGTGMLTDRAAAALRAVDRRHFVQTYSGVPETVAYQVHAHKAWPSLQ